MDPVDAVRSVLTQYATFRGRACRSEYWWFSLAHLVALVVAAVLDVVVFQPLLGGSPAILVVFLGSLVPGLAVTWRRLHDTGRAGGYFFLAYIPLVGPVLLVVALASASTPGPNRFGPSPRGTGPAVGGAPSGGCGAGHPVGR